MHEEFDTHSSHGVATALVMIKCTYESLKDVIEQLCSIEGILDVLEIIGEYNILAKLESHLRNL